MAKKYGVSYYQSDRKTRFGWEFETRHQANKIRDVFKAYDKQHDLKLFYLEDFELLIDYVLKNITLPLDLILKNFRERNL